MEGYAHRLAVVGCMPDRRETAAVLSPVAMAVAVVVVVRVGVGVSESADPWQTGVAVPGGLLVSALADGWSDGRMVGCGGWPAG